MQKLKNPFPILNLSPWPIILSLCLMSMAFFFIKMLYSNSMNSLNLMIFLSMGIWMTLLWWNDIKKESSFLGNHEKKFMMLLKYSMVMFISSEIMFFFSFFWAFFYSSISPNIEIGSEWPPNGIYIFNPMEMPMLNSIILLSSGASITWSHHSFLSKNINLSIKSLLMTIFLGLIFTIFQSMEYNESNFSFSDSIYGNTFFITTGFHGIHVIIGTMFLTHSLLSMIYFSNSKNHFICFDLSAWYWHFVDVVWLFLFLSIYWWGS